MLGWYVSSDGSEPVGPVSQDLLVRGIREGRVPLDSRICAVGSAEWRQLVDVPAFAAAIRDVAPPPPAVQSIAVPSALQPAAVGMVATHDVTASRARTKRRLQLLAVSFGSFAFAIFGGGLLQKVGFDVFATVFAICFLILALSAMVAALFVGVGGLWRRETVARPAELVGVLHPGSHPTTARGAKPLKPWQTLIGLVFGLPVFVIAGVWVVSGRTASCGMLERNGAVAGEYVERDGRATLRLMSDNTWTMTTITTGDREGWRGRYEVAGNMITLRSDSDPQGRFFRGVSCTRDKPNGLSCGGWNTGETTLSFTKR